MFRAGIRFNTIRILGILAIMPFSSVARAADVHVLATTALQPLFEKLAPSFERTTGNRLIFSWGASSGTQPDTILARIKSGAEFDLSVMIGTALDDRILEGHFRQETRVELATSRVGLAVRAGAPKPDIGSIDGLRRTLLAARLVAFSSGVSGV